MTIERRWAFLRRVIYGTGFSLVLTLMVTGLYFIYGYQAPNCLDGFMNGVERGIDCGGGCARICSMDVSKPYVQWVKAFRVSEGVYNAVAYLENRNINAGVPNLKYTLKLFDADGLIAERSGETPLPPNTIYPVFEGRISTGDRIPTETVIEFESESIWVEAVLNGDRYKTERRELMGADKRPVLTATLRNETLDEAQDVDVVATIFDAQGTPLTASRTKIPSFPGRTSKDVTFTWPEPIATTIRSCEVPTDVMVLLDRSGSMAADGGTPPEPLESAKKAAAQFVEELTSKDQVGYISYATEPSQPIESGLSKDRSATEALILSTTLGKNGIQYTNIGAAITAAAEELLSVRHDTNARKILILLTDGDVTRPVHPETGMLDREYASEYALKAAFAAREKNISIYTIGLGDTFTTSGGEVERDAKLIENIASDPAYYHVAPSAADLSRVYKEISTSLCEQGAAVIDIIAKQTATFSPIQ